MNDPVVIFNGCFIIGCRDVKWIIMLQSHGMKLLVAYELVCNPELIACAEFDWISAQ